MKLRFQIFYSRVLLLLFLSQPFAALAANDCAATVGLRSSSTKIEFSEDLLLFLRSNPRWSWKWFKDQQVGFNPELKLLSKMVGVVGGDIKPDNVDAVVKGKKFTFGIVDFDDGGRGSYLGDLVHTLAYNQAWPIVISFDTAIQSYKAGLIQKMPPLFSAVDFTGYAERVQKFEKKLKKYEKSRSDFFKSLKLIEFEDVSGNNKQLLAKTANPIEEVAQKYGEVIFKGVRIKTSGGSQGVLRVTYLIQSPREGLKILEFKHQTQAAVADSKVKQLAHPERLQELNQFYRPDQNWGHILEVLTHQGETFIVREKKEPVFDAELKVETMTERRQYELMVRSMFEWLGFSHGIQNPDYVEAWLKDSEQIQPELKKLVHQQIQAAAQLTK